MDQSTIFDDQFDQSILVRRRQLLPVLLKVYIWFGMVSAGIMLLAGLFTLASVLFIQGAGWAAASLVMFIIPFSFWVFSMVAVLWFEKKWGIRYNYILGGIWLLLLIIAAISNGINFIQLLGGILSLPYWYLLYKIQSRWERS